MKKLGSLLFVAVSLFGVFAFAQVVPVSPQDFFAQVLQAISVMGGLPAMAKISSIIVLVIASMKVTAINNIFWQKLGGFKTFLAPVLGIIAGVIMLPQVTLPAVVAYMFAGGGAIALHELLDALKAVPGLGSVYVYIIDMIEAFFNPLAAAKKEVKA